VTHPPNPSPPHSLVKQEGKDARYQITEHSPQRLRFNLVRRKCWLSSKRRRLPTAENEKLEGEWAGRVDSAIRNRATGNGKKKIRGEDR